MSKPIDFQRVKNFNVFQTKMNPSDYQSQYEELREMLSGKTSSKGGWTQSRESRAKKYKQWENEYDGQWDEWVRQDFDDVEKRDYFKSNTFPVILDFPVNMLFSERPHIYSEDDVTQSYVDALIRQFDLVNAYRNASVEILKLAGVVLKIAYIRTANGMTPKPVFVHPSHYDVFVDPISGEVEKNVLTYDFQVGDFITRTVEVDEFNSFKTVVMKKHVEDKEFTISDISVTEHGIGHLVKYVSFTKGAFNQWGRSEIEMIGELIREKVNRLSRVKRVLDIHSNPKLFMPADVFNSLVSDQHVVNYDEETRMSYTTISGKDIYSIEEGDQQAYYLTWDANTDAVLAYLKEIRNELGVIASIPIYVIQPTDGEVPESGRAMRISMTNTKLKAQNMGAVLSSSMQWALETCLSLEETLGLQKFPDRKPVHVEFQVNLPEDEQFVTDEILKVTNGVQSKYQTLRNLHRSWSAQQIEDELKQMDVEASEHLEDVSDSIKRKGIVFPAFEASNVTATEGNPLKPNVDATEGDSKEVV